MSKQPYYLDFNTINNNISDRIGRQFSNESTVDQSQSKINQRINDHLFDNTQQYKINRQCDNPIKQFLSVKPSNQQDKYQSVSDNNQQPSLSFWGINNSNRQSVESMSPEYLAMKQQQELTQQQQNSHPMIDDIKYKHAMERQILLEKTNQNNLVSNKLDGANITGYSNNCLTGAVCLNAQGEWLDQNPLNYNQPNKYQMFKKMSPETLNAIYGRPTDQPILTNTDNLSYVNDDVDVFQLTSFNQAKIPTTQPNLRQRELDAYQRILGDKGNLQSFSQNMNHTNIPYSNFGN